MRATTARCFQTILADDPAKAAKALGEALRNAAIEQCIEETEYPDLTISLRVARYRRPGRRLLRHTGRRRLPGRCR